jgi:hypothetical protein
MLVIKELLSSIKQNLFQILKSWSTKFLKYPMATSAPL